jgi:hypothetical protein
MNLKTLLTATLLAATTVAASAATRARSKTIVIDSPANLPFLAESAADAMYLQDTNDGRTLLYIEAQNGRMLSSLDVTDPAKIQRFAQTELPSHSAFDFVGPVGSESVLIRYRDGSGTALLNFKHYKHPVLFADAGFDPNYVAEPLGHTGLLLASGEFQNATRQPTENADRNFKVVDTTNPSQPVFLATVADVEQRLAKTDTGTLFLLNKHGVTVVRRLRVEQGHQAEVDAERGN